MGLSGKAFDGLNSRQDLLFTVLDSCTENVVIKTINSIGAIGDLLFWSFNLDEPPVENVGQVGLLLRSLSDLLLEADFVRSQAIYNLSNAKGLKCFN